MLEFRTDHNTNIIALDLDKNAEIMIIVKVNNSVESTMLLDVEQARMLADFLNDQIRDYEG